MRFSRRACIAPALLCCLILFPSCARNRRVALLQAPAQPPTAEPESEHEDQAEAAAAFYLLKRAPDGKNLPVERYVQAKRSLAGMRIYSTARKSYVASMSGRPHIATDPDSAGTGGWTPLGPGNIGGRTRSLVINPNDPNTMYAGSTGGGVWKTTDGGASWVPLTDLFPSIGIGSLAMDPQSPNTLYAGTGDPLGSVAIRGAGIFKTTDGGNTWNQLPGTATPDFYFVNKVVVSPQNSNNVYAATETGVWFSPDGGVTWTQSLDRSSPNNGCQDLAIRNDQSTDYIFAACGRSNDPPSAIFRNMDAAGSGSWTQVFSVPGMGRASLALAPSNQSIIYTVIDSVDPNKPNFLDGLLGVYRSTSNGDSGTWQARVTNSDPNRVNVSLLSYHNDAFADICSGGKPSFKGQGWLDIVIAVDPTNTDRVWVGGIDLYRSDDGGANWGIAMFWNAGGSQRAHADNHALVFAPGYNGADNQVLYNTSDGGIFMTSNANADLATGDHAGCLPYTSKVAWKSLNNGYAVTQFHYGAPYPSGLWYWGGTQDNGTIRGSDSYGANAWRTVAGGDGGFVAINPNDANIIYHEFTNLSLSKSTNGGQTFSDATQGITDPDGTFLFIPPFTLDPGNPNRLYIGGRSLWRSDDGTATWNQASAQLPSGSGTISYIAVSPTDSNRVLFGTSTGFIFRNGNATGDDSSVAWDSARPRRGYLSQIAFDPQTPDVAYASYSTFKGGSDNYVYKTTDGGATWTGIDGSGSSGLPDAPVSSIVVDPLNNSTIYAGTDLGVFVSLDGGTTWSREDAPYADAPIENLAIDRGSGMSYLFAFTQGRGAWRIALPDSGSPCQYSVSGNTLAFNAYGGPQQVGVTTGDSCVWVAIASGAFSVVSPASGTGSGNFSISAPLNTSNLPRTGTVLLQGQTITVSQDGAQVAHANDEPASAQVISSLPYVGLQDSRRFTSGSADPVHSCTGSADSKTIWWSVTPAASGTLTLTAQGERYDVFGNSGIVFTVYDTQPTADHELVCASQPRDTSPWRALTVAGPVTQGTTYWIEISATGNAPTDGGFTIVTAALQ